MTNPKTAPKAAATPAKKPAFNVSTLGALAKASGADTGAPKRALLADIELDPEQPRKSFPQDELEALAGTIKLKGVLQPVTLKPGVSKKWMIVYGERRYRASQLAGVADIPYFEAGLEQSDFVSQVIENQQRSALTNSELAAAVAKVAAEGMKNKEIAATFNLKEYQISAYRAVEKYPPCLRSILDNSDIRGLYDVFRVWEKEPVAVETALVVFSEGLSYSDAQRVIHALTGKAQNNSFAPRAEKEAPPTAAAPAQRPTQAAPSILNTPPPAPASEQVEAARSALQQVLAQTLKPQAPQEPQEAPEAPSPVPTPPSAPVPASGEASKAVLRIYVATGDGEVGYLVQDERAKVDGHVIVAFESFREEVPVDGLKITSVQ